MADMIDLSMLSSSPRRPSAPGSRYDATAPMREVSAAVRADLAAAVRDGYLPAVSCRVRTVHGDLLVTIHGLDDDQVHDGPGRPTDAAAELAARVERIIDEYNTTFPDTHQRAFHSVVEFG